MKELNICEIFYSVEGETSLVGKPAVFIRLAGCNLNCKWCDTVYARKKGKKRKMTEILNNVIKYNCPIVVITGGEPLLQKESLNLMKELILKGYRVVLETNGSKEISSVSEKVKIVLDLKTPSSCETDKMDFLNIKRLKKTDELKFVVADKQDFDWSCAVLKEYKTKVKEILFSPVRGRLSFKRLASWVMQEMPGARIQTNIHKVFSLQ